MNSVVSSALVITIFSILCSNVSSLKCNDFKKIEVAKGEDVSIFVCSPGYYAIQYCKYASYTIIPQQPSQIINSPLISSLLSDAERPNRKMDIRCIVTLCYYATHTLLCSMHRISIFLKSTFVNRNVKF